VSAEPKGDYEPKGHYYEIATTSGGNLTVKPVAVPSHVREQRRREARRRQIEHCVARNRERESRMSVRSILFYSMILVAVCLVCYLYLTLQSRVTAHAAEVSKLQSQVSAKISANDILQKRIETRSDLFKIKTAAAKDLGMKQITKKQIVYYSVQNQDYVLSYK
jgi:cell division protein FtsL